MPLLEIPSSLATARWLIYLAIFTIFIAVSLELFAMILDVRIFTAFEKNLNAVAEKIIAY